MIDFREKKNRKEAFILWWVWSIRFKDCDPAVWMTQYLNDRYEHNIEERYWLAWLYGNTYQLPTAWVLKNEFPDFELATTDRITDWNNKNYKRLRYQTDTKWNKGHLPSMFESYKRFIGECTQKERFEQFCVGGEEENFERVWDAVITNLHKFGRYSTWFYMQHLKHTCNLPIDATSLKLDDYSGSRSHRNGLLYALGQEEYVDEKLQESHTLSLKAEANEMRQDAIDRFPQYVNELDFFTMETCLCSFKKIFRTREGRYLGYYLDRQSEEITKAESDGWYGIDWDVTWQARNETLDPRLSKRSKIEKDRFGGFLSTGNLDRMSWLTNQQSAPVGLEGFMEN